MLSGVARARGGEALPLAKSFPQPQNYVKKGTGLWWGQSVARNKPEKSRLNLLRDEPRRPRGRFALAWRVLLGEPIVPEQIREDWLSYRLLFDDLLNRFGAMLARQAKAEHARMREQLEEPTFREQPTPLNRKAAVRAKVAASRGLMVHRGGAAPAYELDPRQPLLFPDADGSADTEVEEDEP